MDDLQKEIESLYNFGYKMNLDAVWKWAAIWKVVKELRLYETHFKCVDIGGGLSPLHWIFSKYGEVVNVEFAGFSNTWFPVNDNGFYSESPGIPHDRRNICYVQDDFLSYVKEIPDNSIDFFYDGCAFIHFNPQKRFSHNDGIVVSMKEIARTLKPGGYFVSASDVAHPDAREVGEFIHPHHLNECFLSSGLKSLGETDLELEPFFMNKENVHQSNTCTPNHLMDTPIACTSSCRALPEYHCLCEAKVGTILTRCLYTLTKPIDLIQPQSINILAAQRGQIRRMLIRKDLLPRMLKQKIKSRVRKIAKTLQHIIN
jgi:SAM-dependent methyltransferase